MRRVVLLLACALVVTVVAVATAGSTAASYGRRLHAELVTSVAAKAGRVTRLGGAKSCGTDRVPVMVSFRARVAIPNSRSWYEVIILHAASHAGVWNRTHDDLRAGQRVQMALSLPGCPGAVHGIVFYTRHTGPRRAWVLGVSVGRFALRSG